MASWKVALLGLCAIGLLKEFDVGHLFLDDYLSSKPYNLTRDEINFEVMPVSAYTSFGITVAVLVIADIVLYKGVISLGITSHIVYLCLITWGHELLLAKLSIFARSFGASTDIAYFGYAFAIAEPEFYHKVSGFSRASLLLGKLLAYSLGEILVLAFRVDFLILNYISLVSVCIAFVFSLFIVSASKSDLRAVIERELQTPGHSRFTSTGSVGNGYLQSSHSQPNTVQRKHAGNSISSIPSDFGNMNQESPGLTSSGPLCYDIDTSSLGFSYNDMMSEASDVSSLERARMDDSQALDIKEEYSLKEQFLISAKSLKETFSTRSVIMWSVFWVLITLIDLQVASKINLFLNDNYPDRDAAKFDSTVETVSVLVGFITVLIVSYISILWASFEVLFLTGTSLLLCVLVGLLCGLYNLWMTYCLSAALRVCYQIFITIAMYRVAFYVKDERFALVFGVNMAGAALCHLVLSGASTATKDVQFSLVAQFAVLAGMIGLFGLVMICGSIFEFVAGRRSLAVVQDDLDTLVRE